MIPSMRPAETFCFSMEYIDIPSATVIVRSTYVRLQYIIEWSFPGFRCFAFSFKRSAVFIFFPFFHRWACSIISIISIGKTAFSCLDLFVGFSAMCVPMFSRAHIGIFGILILHVGNKIISIVASYLPGGVSWNVTAGA